MIWSFSNHNTFRRCQRQWFYKSIYAHWNAKDKLRQEAWRLSKLTNVRAWRGRIVDEAISMSVIPAVNRRIPVTLRQTKQMARNLFVKQRSIMLKASQTKTVEKLSQDSFSGFYELEYGNQLSEQVFVEAWSEVEQALNGLFNDSRLRRLLKESQLLIPQRSLSFKHEGVTIRAKPDVICIYTDKQPLIIDWKVHLNPIRDYWLQLVTYAIALSRCTPHRDWCTLLSQVSPADVRLKEIQLLNSEVRTHQVTEDDIEEVEDMISCSTEEMLLAIDGRDRKELKAECFPAAFKPSSCQFCNFRKICWGEET